MVLVLMVLVLMVLAQSGIQAIPGPQREHAGPTADMEAELQLYSTYPYPYPYP